MPGTPRDEITALLRRMGAGDTRAAEARVMRQVLVDHARRKNAKKRTGEHEAITIERVPELGGRSPLDVIALSEAMDRLAAPDDRKARVVERRLFAEMTLEETAEALGVSKRTAEGDWYFARACLQEQLA